MTTISRPTLWPLLSLPALALLVGSPSGAGGPPPPSDDSAIIHVLNRVTYGPRPGDVERIRRIGVEAFVEEQLTPAELDDADVERHVARLETAGLDAATLVERYHGPAQMARRRQRRPDNEDTPPRPDESGPSTRLTPEIRRGRLPLQELMTQRLVRAVSSERQLQEILVDFWFNHFNVSARKGPLIQPLLVGYERDVIRPHVLGRFRDLLGAVAQSPAMLVYLDNWLSVDPDARAERPPRARRGGSIRRFPRPGLESPGQTARRRGGGRRESSTPLVQPGRRRGLNENYARELLELHTLGVDGGYDQSDVVEVAKAFTGWTIAPLRNGGRFVFADPLHVDGPKHVLGQEVDAGGQADGEAVLDLLAQHPSTARRIATKLVRRFVADDPPAALVERAADTFLETDGDLRAVTAAILTSAEFFSDETRNAQVKTPLEFVVSSIRALDGRLLEGHPPMVARTLEQLGMPLYQCQPPTGYSDRAEDWVNAGALVARMNFSVALVSGRIPGLDLALPSEPEAALRELGSPAFHRQ